MPYALRRLFATIFVYCEASNVRTLWDDVYNHLSEDFMNQGTNGDVETLFQTLESEKIFLQSMGKDILMYDLPRFQSLPVFPTVHGYREILDELSISVSSDDLVAHLKLNTGHRKAYDLIINCLDNDMGGLFFVSRPVTGKTFLYHALLSTVRSPSMIALATEPSGVAASILPGGRTAHSRFKIPIELHENSFCSISKQSCLAELLRHAKLIIWDEAPMCKRFAIEAVDRTLQDLVGNNEPFGGKVVVLGGDFMQVLPVIPKATIQKTIDGSLIKSYLYKSLKIIVLTENMRARSDPRFCEFFLRIGKGVEPVDEKGIISLLREMLIKFCAEDVELLEKKLISYVYSKLANNISSATYLTERAILATNNTHVDKLNDKIISMFLGDAKNFPSLDEAIDDT